MQNWTYTRKDGLVPIDPGMPRWEDGEGKLPWLARCGFDTYNVDAPGGDAPGTESYAATRVDARWQYVVDLSAPGGCIEPIWLATFADWLDFMQAYGAVCTSRVLLEHVDRLTQIVTKAFHTWHGHDPISACKKCDPEAWAEWQKVLQGIQARKRSTAA